MRRTLALATAGLLSGMTLSACSDNEPEASPTVSSSASATSTTEPTEPTGPTESTEPDPSSDPTKPALPGLAKRHSQAGARAFIEHYIEALNYSYATSRSGPLRTVSSPKCLACRYLFDDLDEMDQRHGEQVGGEWTVTQIEPLAEHTSTSSSFIVGIDIARGYSIEGDGSPRQAIKPQSVFDEIQAVWRGGRWLVQNVSPA